MRRQAGNLRARAGRGCPGSLLPALRTASPAVAAHMNLAPAALMLSLLLAASLSCTMRAGAQTQPDRLRLALSGRRACAMKRWTVSFVQAQMAVINSC